DELGDAHAPVEDDVQLVALLALAEDHRSLAEALLGGERRQQLHFRRGEAALAEEVDLVLRLDRHLLHLALAVGALASAAALRVFLEEELQLLVRAAHFLGERAPERPVQPDRELLVLVHQLVERAEGERVAGRGLRGHAVAGAMRAVDEVHLAADVIGGQRAEDLRAEGRVLADVDLPFLDDVEVHRAVFLAEDVVAGGEALDARELREPEDLLVLHVLEDGELPEVVRDGDQVLALFGGAGDLEDDVLQVLAAVEAEEVFLPELEALGGQLQLFDALLDPRVERFGLDAVDALEGIDHAAHRLGGLALLVRRQQEGVDEGVERAVEVLQLELDASRDLGESPVEGIELARAADLLVRQVPLALRVVQPAEDLEGAVVVRRLQLRDLEQLDGLRDLIARHVVLREPDILRGVDLVPPALDHELLFHSRVPVLLGELFLIAHPRQIDPQRHGSRLELLRHLVQMDRLIEHPLIRIPPGQRQQILGLDGNVR